MTDQAQQNATPKKRWPKWAKGFLAALTESGNIRLACGAAGVDRSTAYRLRSSDEMFADAWEHAQAKAADLLEKEARRRATEGVQRLKFDRGSLITIPLIGDDGKPVLDQDGKPITTPYIEHEYSDTLLIFLMKGANPEKYRERQSVEHSGPGGGPIRFQSDLDKAYAGDGDTTE